jgi:hypothetical protein
MSVKMDIPLARDDPRYDTEKRRFPGTIRASQPINAGGQDAGRNKKNPTAAV